LALAESGGGIVFQFSIKSLLGLVLAVAVVCTIFFAFSIDVRYITLLVGVVALPAPLLVLYRQGRAFGRAFAFGGLVAYAVWLVLLGVPAGWIAASHFKDYSMWQLGSFYTLVPSYLGQADASPVANFTLQTGSPEPAAACPSN
jgi:hypothetical protein